MVMNSNSLEDHFLFTMEFLQMMEDFQEIEDECPACGHGSRSNTICLREECDFMLFPEMGRIHSSLIPWMAQIARKTHAKVTD